VDKYDGLEIYNHPDDGLCWVWKDQNGQNCICQLTTTEKAIYADVLSIRAKLVTAKNALVGILDFCEEDEMCATVAYKTAIDKVREALSAIYPK
jgi:hypothetical protein